MFGMLDYRANKLLKVFFFPFNLALWVLVYASLTGLILYVGSWETTPLIWKIVAALAIWHLPVGVVLFIIWAAISWLLKKVFFFVIDVLPSEGIEPHEARDIALLGRIGVLDRKMMRRIDDWTDHDTAELIGLFPWRQRLFFPVSERMHYLTRHLKEDAAKGIRMPDDVDGGQNHVRAILEDAGLEAKWFEQVVSWPFTSHAVVQTIIIIGAFVYLSK